MTFIAYSPIGGISHRQISQNEMVVRFSKKYSVSPYCVILGWLLGQSPWILPIPSATRVESANDSPKAAYLELDFEDLNALSQSFTSLRLS